MKKIHIGSKINLVDLPEEPSSDNPSAWGQYSKDFLYAIDNPIAEFEDTKRVQLLLHESGAFTEENTSGLYDIPEGYRVEVLCEKDGSDGYAVKCSDCNCLASLVPIKEEKPVVLNTINTINTDELRHVLQQIQNAIEGEPYGLKEAWNLLSDCITNLESVPDPVSDYKEELIKKIEETRFPISEITTVVKIINLIKQP